jgi:hypothetical protein
MTKRRGERAKHLSSAIHVYCPTNVNIRYSLSFLTVIRFISSSIVKEITQKYTVDDFHDNRSMTRLISAPDHVKTSILRNKVQ